jgi:tRNA threonylcarbamoyladenosine biosynthesis protein TsaE
VSDVVVQVPTAEHMRALGAALGRAAVAGDRFLLHGPFGAGKTTLVQGLARGLDITTPVSSPSFVIEAQYRGRLPLYHIDLYRLEHIEPGLLDELAEHLFGDGVAAVEWAERLPTELASDGTVVHFEVPSAASRRVTVRSDHERITAAARAA